MDDHGRERVEELADRYGRMVFTTTYRILGNRSDAEDAFQEVFLKLIGSLDGQLQAESVRDWGAYLRVMATRCAISLLRAKWARRRERTTLSNNVADPSSQDPPTRETARQMQCLRQALASLSQRDAGVFSLRYFEQLSYEQIAAEMNLSVSQVGVILHRTRKRLRKLVDRALEGSPAGERRVVSHRPVELED